MIIKKNIYAAEDPMGYGDEALTDTIDDLSDTVEDLQDSIDDSDQEDDVSIDIENNISDHFIAECESCGGIFISAVIESDNNAESIIGDCPICGKETTQDLKWIIKSVTEME